MTPPRLRPARPGEAAEIAALLRRSITELCRRDHGDDPGLLDGWLANKTPETAARWIADPGQRVIVAEFDGRLAGVAAARTDGLVLLNYVAPDLVRHGVGAAMLAALEDWLRDRGVAEARLESTVTALDFYRARGYRDSGPPELWLGLKGFPMAKRLARGAAGLVIFDCDGVLVDSEPIASQILLDTLAEAGLRLDPATADERFLGRSLASTVEILAEDFGIRLDDAALQAMRAQLYAAFRAELRPIPGIAAAIDAIACPICVASSSQPERIELSLRLTGLWERFEGRVYSATMVDRGKPAPDLFLHAAAAMGFAPDVCLVVEDSPAGVQAALAGGMRVVGFVGGGHAQGAPHRAALAALGPDRVIDDMRALPGIVNGEG